MPYLSAIVATVATFIQFVIFLQIFAYFKQKYFIYYYKFMFPNFQFSILFFETSTIHILFSIRDLVGAWIEALML